MSVPATQTRHSFRISIEYLQADERRAFEIQMAGKSQEVVSDALAEAILTLFSNPQVIGDAIAAKIKRGNRK